MEKCKVLKFSAEWCASCKKMQPTFEKVAESMAGKLDFSDIDVESDEGVDLSVKYGVRNIPTIIVVQGEEIKERITGTKTEEQLTSILEKYI